MVEYKNISFKHEDGLNLILLNSTGLNFVHKTKSLQHVILTAVLMII